MYYYAAVLLLFRPFLRAKFTESDLVPSELCRQFATAISDLFAKHLSHFGTTGIYTFQIQCLLSACTIHMINLPSIAASSALLTACESFHRLVSHNTWAVGSIKLLKDLTAKWNIILPGDVERALWRSHTELPLSIRERFEDPAAPQAELLRGSKRTAFLNPSSQVMQKRQRLAPVHASSGQPPGQTGSGSGSASGGSAPNTPLGTNVMGSGGLTKEENQRTNSGSHFLFAPFPNQPAPLLGPVHTSTTSEAEDMDELSSVVKDFDGLRFKGDGWFDPFMGI